MDPFAFATIVGLLATFTAGREGKKDIESFKQWLSENNHSNMITIIESNASLQQDLTSFMNQNHEQVMAQLSTLNDLMMSLASHMQGLGSIASRFDFNNGLSDQAIDVLRQFVKSDSVEMRHLQTWSYEGADNIYYLDNSAVVYSEPRFIETDVDSLVNASLITLTRGSKGGAIYKITRQAVRFIDAIDNNQ
ncbi:hypothetical protein [Psychrobacter urativorans]|uniref:Uncharacterized protein n=1 Tax=Psychrobacter urativorans TaxID=45610 RepID=A0A0M4T8R4_9GAMM|nr:hypothetical protein [Psychrobacter urativorans]ALF60309.1 hypothetical protein AOC03_09890 [Psychrobacter urativorans]